MQYRNPSTGPVQPGTSTQTERINWRRKLLPASTYKASGDPRLEPASFSHSKRNSTFVHMKQQRHAVIREILSQSPVSSQDELRRRLARRSFHVTQATLSRDIHELRLMKGPGGYSLPNNGAAEADA